MNIEELRRIRDQEREKDSLQHLPEEFYEEVGAYLADLRDERDRAANASDQPFADPDVRRLSDELETAERVVESLYERRVGKIVKLASFQAADMGAEREGLTAEERELCEAIVQRIRDNRDRVLSTVSAPETSPASPDEPIERGGNGEERSDVMEPEEPTDEPPSPAGSDSERTKVRITQDVGEIVGTDDRTYELATDDIVSLPTKNAKPLLTRGAAEPVD